MSWTVTPSVYFDDLTERSSRVACKADQIGQAPVVMSDLEFKWGREGYYDSIDPAECKMTLWDSTGDWARRIRDSKALGTHVEVKWEARHPDRPGYYTHHVLYRGLVTGVNARRLERTDDQDRHIWEIRLTCHDPVSSLGNIYPLPGVLPALDRLAYRRNWIKGLLEYGGIVIKELDFQPAYGNALMVPYEVGKESALELVTKMYDSMSLDAFSYIPTLDGIYQAERHDGDYTTFLVSYGNNRGAVLISTNDAFINKRTRGGLGIPGCSLEVDEGMELEATPDTDINRVETTYKKRNDKGEWVDHVISAENVSVGQPRRVLTNETWITPPDGDDVSRGMLELQHRSMWERAREEGRRPRHPNIRFRAGKEFPTLGALQWWLQTWEDARPGFINGDEAHRWMMDGDRDWEPIVSPLGGTVTYNGHDGWHIEMTVQWSHNRRTVTPITWSKLQQMQWTTESDPVPWWWEIIGLPTPPPRQVGTPTPERDVRWGEPDGDTGEYRFDTSVTWSDLKFLDNTAREIKDVLK